MRTIHTQDSNNMPRSQHVLFVCLTASLTSLVLNWCLKPQYPVPAVFGTVAPGFEDVKEVFRSNYEEGWDNSAGGSAFAVYLSGQKVVDIWAGYADEEAGRLWDEDTLSIICSTNKGLMAVSVAMLVDRGFLDFKERVSHYWPEFGQRGKDNVTVEQLLEHEAGLYVTKRPLTFELLKDLPALDASVAETEPSWTPGTRHGYHGLTYGPIVDGLFRRADPENRTIGQFFDEEVRRPFGIDAFIGLPVEKNYRMARLKVIPPTLGQRVYSLLTFDLAGRNVLNDLISKVVGPKEFTNAKILQHCGEVCDVRRLVDPTLLRIELASCNGVATARGVAKLFGILANGGKHGNKTLLSEKIINEYSNDERGLTPDLVWYDHPLRWKYGMNIVPQGNGLGNLFGSVGAGGQFGYADPNNRLGYGFVSRYFTPISLEADERVNRLVESVLRAYQKHKQS